AVTVLGPGRDAWSWCRWLPDGGPRVVVVDVAGQARAAATVAVPRPGDPWPVAKVPAGPADGTGDERVDAVVLCLPDDEVPPSWCRAVWQLHAGGPLDRRAPDGSAESAPAVGVSTAWAERVARRAAGLAGMRRELAQLDPTGGTRTGAPGPASPAGPYGSAG
ncbi:hypothetical protein ABE437_20575, partial [Isoptericola cucumis]|uniref:hypothetical protein n=1 Tax=Isoptericola cucumis TaxID=1776856 RepID=UPI00320AB223